MKTGCIKKTPNIDKQEYTKPNVIQPKFIFRPLETAFGIKPKMGMYLQLA